MGDSISLPEEMKPLKKKRMVFGPRNDPHAIDGLMTMESVIPFGMYKGKTWRDVIKPVDWYDPNPRWISYMKWILSEATTPNFTILIHVHVLFVILRYGQETLFFEGFASDKSCFDKKIYGKAKDRAQSILRSIGENDEIIAPCRMTSKELHDTYLTSATSVIKTNLIDINQILGDL